MSTDRDNVRSHYQGEAGQRYFVGHSGDVLGSRWNLFIFEDHVSASDSVLDFGCGAGGLLALLPAQRKVGIEVNPAAYARLDALGIPRVSSLFDLSVQVFTLIISSHSLEHLTNPFETLEKMREHLAPGGQLLLLVPMDDYHNKTQRKFVPGDSNQHLYAWTPLVLGNLLTAAGYEVVSLDVVTHAWPLHSGRIAKWLWEHYPQLFHIAAWLTAFIYNRRQIFAVATIKG